MSRRRFSGFVEPSVARLFAALFAFALLAASLAATRAEAAPPVLCPDVMQREHATNDAPCLAETNGVVERDGDRLILHAANRDVAFAGNHAACETDDVQGSCHRVSLYAFSAEFSYAVLLDSTRSATAVLLVDLKTGAQMPLDAPPAFSPSGGQILTVAKVWQLSTAEIELAIYDVTVLPPQMTYALPYGMASALAHRPDAAVGFRFVAWPEENRIQLSVNDGAADTPDLLTLDCVDGNWTLPRLEGKK